jgi:hypothetical protein
LMVLASGSRDEVLLVLVSGRIGFA